MDRQQRVHEWAELVFGSAHDIDVLFNRAAEEFSELEFVISANPELHAIHAVKDNKEMYEEVKKEMADIVITLFRMAGSLGFDLLEEVDRKQSINEGRKWISHGDGTGHHVKNP